MNSLSSPSLSCIFPAGWSELLTLFRALWCWIRLHIASFITAVVGVQSLLFSHYVSHLECWWGRSIKLPYFASLIQSVCGQLPMNMSYLSSLLILMSLYDSFLSLQGRPYRCSKQEREHSSLVGGKRWSFWRGPTFGACQCWCGRSRQPQDYPTHGCFSQGAEFVRILIDSVSLHFVKPLVTNN